MIRDYKKDLGRIVTLCSILIVIIWLASCGNGTNKPTQLNYGKYIAYNRGDTAIALLNISKKIFSGSLEINYHGAYKDSGEVKGIVKDDTLIGEFHFLHYQLEWKRKPLALLRKKDKMIMGEGFTKFTVGIPHFDPQVPINFDENERFVFVEVKK